MRFEKSKRTKTKQNPGISKDSGTNSKGVTYIYSGNIRNRRKRNGNIRNTLNYNDWEFLQINVRHQTTDPGGSETISRINAKNK